MYIRLDQGIYMVGAGKGGPGISHEKDCNVYLLTDGHAAALIDGGSGLDTPAILSNVRETGVEPGQIEKILVTHAHGDHGGGIRDFQELLPQVQVYASAGEKRLLESGTEEELGLIAAKRKGAYPQDYQYKHCQVDHVVTHEQTLTVGTIGVTAILLPGHSIESVCYLVEMNGKRYLFSGDSIYLNGTLSVINCYGSSMESYRKYIGRLAGRRVDALIPSHYRFTMSGGQKHIDLAIELTGYSSLPPMQ